MQEQTQLEEIRVRGSELIDQVRRLIHEGNVRRVVIKQEDRTIVEFPLTFGVVGVMFAPILAAVGAIAALLNDCTIQVERDTSAAQPTTSDTRTVQVEGIE